MSWKHVVLCIAGLGAAIGSFFIPGASVVVLPLATGVVGGALGHAQGGTAVAK